MIVNITGRSGAGKTTLIRYLVANCSGYRLVKSYTSRARRAGESDDVYHFVDASTLPDSPAFMLRRVRGSAVYALKVSDLRASDGNIPIFAFPAKGVVLLEGLGFPVQCFYLELSEPGLIARMQGRGDAPDDVLQRVRQDAVESSLEATRAVLGSRELTILDAQLSIEELAKIVDASVKKVKPS